MAAHTGGTYGYIDMAASSSSGTAVQSIIGGVPNSATRGPYLLTNFYNTSVAKIGGQAVYCSTAATGSSTTAIATGVRYRVTYTAVIRANTSGNVSTRTNSLGLSGTDTFTVGSAGSDFQFTVSAGGTFDWARAAGSETYEVTVWAVWI